MSKYIDAEKLIAEIERGLSAHDKVDHLEAHEVGKAWNRGHRRALENILDFIASLQQEQPEVDLEEEIDKKAQELHITPCYDELKNFARHFYELGKNARKSMWHSVAEEIPTENGLEVIVACRNKNKEDGIWLYDLIQCWEGKWEPRVNWETPVKWAYVRDLDNARKEEQI